MVSLRQLSITAVVLILLRSFSAFAGQQANQDLIRRYSQQAARALAEKNAGAAEAALEPLARLTPNDPDVQANLGTVYYMQGHYEEAATRLRTALQLNPGLSNVRPLLGICYAELGRPQEAVPLLGPAFRQPPSEAVGRLIGIELMDAYRSLNDNYPALEVSEELLRRYPNDAEILYRAGHLYGDRSLEIMQRLVKVAPNSPWKRMAFAEALEGEKRYDVAIIEYRKVIASDPLLPEVHYRLGKTLLLNSVDSSEAQNEAIKQFEEELRTDPRNAAAEYELGEIYRRRGQTQKAADYFSRAVRIDPRRDEAQISLARALVALGRPSEALPHLNTAIQLDPEDSTAHFLLAQVYRDQKDSAGYRREMALYRKYHLDSFGDEDQSGPPLSRGGSRNNP